LVFLPFNTKLLFLKEYLMSGYGNEKENKIQLDQFYTNRLIYDKLVLKIKEILPKEFKKVIFLERSAGTSSFLFSLQELKIKKLKYMI